MFIDRDVFAIVISLFLVFTGALTALQLPMAQYPQIALPTVRVSAVYQRPQIPSASRQPSCSAGLMLPQLKPTYMRRQHASASRRRTELEFR